jgi:hypothetical protein
MAAITAAVIGVAGTMYASNKASKAAKEQQKLGREAIDAADPYKQYRPAAAEKLNALIDNPADLSKMPSFEYRQQAAQRQLAAQGYTGSGNAIIEAANAGGAAYQQEFDNLSMLSGAGQAPGGGYNSAMSGNAAANDNYLSSLSGVTNNLTNLATVAGGFNQSASAGGGTAPAYNPGVGTGPP